MPAKYEAWEEYDSDEQASDSKEKDPKSSANVPMRRDEEDQESGNSEDEAESLNLADEQDALNKKIAERAWVCDTCSGCNPRWKHICVFCTGRKELLHPWKPGDWLCRDTTNPKGCITPGSQVRAGIANVRLDVPDRSASVLGLGPSVPYPVGNRSRIAATTTSLATSGANGTIARR